MKKLCVVSLSLVLAASIVSAGYGWPSKKQTKPAVPAQEPATANKAAAEPKATPAAEQVSPTAEVSAPAQTPSISQEELDRLRALREKKKAQLNNTEWDIEVVPMSGKGEKQKDTLVFKDNKFSSNSFSSMGFAPSNFTVSVPEAAMTVAETMQSSEKEGMVFWRLEFDATLASCKGVLSRQLAENKSEDYSFVSAAKRPLTQASVPAVPAVTKAAPVPAPAAKPSGK